MTPTEAAASLHLNQYREEGSPALFKEMAASGLVAVFGASDDLVVLNGAINDELGLGRIHLDPKGLITSRCEDVRCGYHRDALKSSKTIDVTFHDKGSPDGGFTFTYQTEIPHVTFSIMEDDMTYCRGIVFLMSDLADAPVDASIK